MEVTIANKSMTLKKGTPLHCSIVTANIDADKFGEDRMAFNPDRPQIREILTWNCLDKLFDTGNMDDGFIRRCPGYDVSLNLIQIIITNSVNANFTQNPIPRVIRPIIDRSPSQVEATLDKFSVFFQQYNNGKLTIWNFDHPTSVDLAVSKKNTSFLYKLSEGWSGFNVPYFDEDWNDRLIIKVLDAGAILSLHVFPMTDKDDNWSSIDEAVRWRQARVGKY